MKRRAPSVVGTVIPVLPASGTCSFRFPSLMNFFIEDTANETLLVTGTFVLSERRTHLFPQRCCRRDSRRGRRHFQSHRHSPATHRYFCLRGGCRKDP